MSAKSRARRARKAEADRILIAAALAIKCPAPNCKAAPGVWCGPVMEGWPRGPIEPWMHDRRYTATEQTTQVPAGDAGGGL